MANRILTIDMITRESLRILENELVVTRNCNRQYDKSFAVEGAKIGDTLRIRLPDRVVVSDGAVFQNQAENQQYTTLTVSSQKHVGCSFTSAEMTMSLQDYSDTILKPRISQLAATHRLRRGRGCGEADRPVGRHPRHDAQHLAGRAVRRSEVERVGHHAGRAVRRGQPGRERRAGGRLQGLLQPAGRHLQPVQVGQHG
jgi:hypothetical protein